MSPSFYRILNLEPSATPKEIDRAYKRQALLYHPDRNPDASATEDFQKILEAHQTLSDPIKRIVYDAKLRRPKPPRSTTNPPPPPPSPPPFNPRPPKPARSYTTPVDPPITTTTTTNTRVPLSSAYTKVPTPSSRPKQSKTFYANRRPSSANPSGTSSSFFSGLFASAPPPPPPQPPAPPPAEAKAPEPERKPTKEEVPKPSRTGSSFLDEFLSRPLNSESLDKFFSDARMGSGTTPAPVPNLFMYTDPMFKQQQKPRSTSARAEPNLFGYPDPIGPRRTSRPMDTHPDVYSYEARKGPRVTTSPTTPKLNEPIPKIPREESVRGRTRENDWNRPNAYRSPIPDHHVHRRSASSSNHYRSPHEVFTEYNHYRENLEEDGELYGVQWPPVRNRDSRETGSINKGQIPRVEEWVKSSGSGRIPRVEEWVKSSGSESGRIPRVEEWVKSSGSFSRT